MRVACLLVMVAGCLSTPGPAGGGDDDDDGGPGDGGIDAPTDAAGSARCRGDAVPAGLPWPPPAIAARSALIADVDGDDVGDLVVSVAPLDPDAAGASGVYVLYGPVSPSAPRYHAFLDLDDDVVDAELQPVATSVDDLDGDGCLDLTVAGPPTLSNAESRVAIWRHNGSAVPWAGVARRGALGFEPEALGPVMLQWGDLALGGERDLAVADLYNVEIRAGSSATAVGPSVAVPQPASCTWGNINALAVQPNGTGRERLLVFGHYTIHRVDIDDEGDPSVSDTCTSTGAPITRGATRVDLDGRAPLDLVSGAAATLGAHLIDGANPVLSPTTGTFSCAANPRGSDQYIEGFAAGDLGGTAAPDIVIIDYDDQSQPPGSYACLVNAISATSTLVSHNGANEIRVGDTRLRTLAVGDAGGGVRAWLLDVDGTLHCVRRTVGVNALEAC